MKEFDFKNTDWSLIRQALSFSLLKNESVLLKGAFDSIAALDWITPIYSDLKQVVIESGFGILTEIDGDIAFKPEQPGHSTFYISAGKFTPLSEIELFLLPYLFKEKFRSVILFQGVTHSHISYSSTFLKETLFGLLEKIGYYSSMNLKRFGFYGSGQGVAESRIYPAEPYAADNIFQFKHKRIEGVKILVAGMNMEIAEREKDFVKRNIAVDESRISILEIIDANGFGNSIQVYFSCDDINFIISRDMEFYNSNGDFIFDENAYYRSLSDLADKCSLFLKNDTVPFSIQKEMLPYLYMTESAISQELKETPLFNICERML
ncbi:MAG: RNA 3'-terminal phosphate cyclase [Spirochaetota bacterium]